MPWGRFEPLFVKRFPRLQKVKFLLQAWAVSILNNIVNREHAQAVELEFGKDGSPHN